MLTPSVPTLCQVFIQVDNPIEPTEINEFPPFMPIVNGLGLMPLERQCRVASSPRRFRGEFSCIHGAVEKPLFCMGNEVELIIIGDRFCNSDHGGNRCREKRVPTKAFFGCRSRASDSSGSPATTD
jgi:hypothetical protein